MDFGFLKNYQAFRVLLQCTICWLQWRNLLQAVCCSDVQDLCLGQEYFMSWSLLIPFPMHKLAEKNHWEWFYVFVGKNFNFFLLMKSYWSRLRVLYRTLWALNQSACLFGPVWVRSQLCCNSNIAVRAVGWAAEVSGSAGFFAPNGLTSMIMSHFELCDALFLSDSFSRRYRFPFFACNITPGYAVCTKTSILKRFYIFVCFPLQLYRNV